MGAYNRAILFALFLGACASVPAGHGDVGHGVALGFVVPGPALERALGEVHTLGANEVSILVPLYTEGRQGRTVRRGALDDARGGDGELVSAPVVTTTDTTTAPTTETTTDATTETSARSDAQLAEVIARAHAHGLSVLVFPIVRLRVRNPGEWRGTLAPPDREAWWDEYAAQLVAVARVASRARAERLTIGSELVSFEGADDARRWIALAARVRATFGGALSYSANWDRYRDVPFWGAVDEVGISAYFTLAPRGTSPGIEQLVAAWAPLVDDLRAFAASIERPITFTEVGFPSVHGAAFWPWNDHQLKTACATGEGCDGTLDLEAQRRLWAAFVRVFGSHDPQKRAATSFLRGLYVWLWSGRGGLRDRGYTPRGKPAETVLKLWYGEGRSLPIH